jgi:hypothetical protein
MKYLQQLIIVITAAILWGRSGAMAAEVRVVSVSTMSRVSPLAKDLPAKVDQQATLWAARGEHEAAQLVVAASDQALSGLKATCTDLRFVNGDTTIPANNVTCYVVGFLPDNPERKIPPELEHVLVEDRTLPAWPDPLERRDQFDVGAGAAQPLWIDVQVPENAAAGAYRGSLRVTGADVAIDFPIVLNVWDFAIGHENHLPNLFYLWEQGIAEAHKVSQRDPSYAAIRQEYVKSYLDHRISPAAPSYYPLAIRQKLTRDGALTTDWSVFDSDLTAAMRQGQTAFLWPGTWNIGLERRYGGSFEGPFVEDEQTQTMVWPDFMKDWEKRTPEDLARVAEEYGKMVAHLKEKGWLDKSVAYLSGEPHKGEKSNVPSIDDFEFTNQILKWAHQANPAIRTMVAMNAAPFAQEISENVDIWAIDATAMAGSEKLEERERQRGRKVWTYLPALYRTDAIPGAFRIGPWFCWRYKLDGYGPITDLTAWFAYKAFPNGCVLYPGKNGPMTSIRLELIRDGMEDYEYLWTLDHLASQLRKSQPNSPLLAQATKLLADRRVIRGKDPLKAGNWDYSGESIVNVRREIGELCQQLSRMQSN